MTTQISLPSAGQTVELVPAGSGMYDFGYSSTLLHRTNGDAANLLLFEDRWCGNGVEGQCYRTHCAILQNDQGTRLVESANIGDSVEEVIEADGISLKRLDTAPAWIRISEKIARRNNRNG